MMKARSNTCNFFYRFVYLPKKRHCVCCAKSLWPSFLRSIFSCYAFAIKTVQWKWISPADLPRLSRQLTVELLLFLFAIIWSAVIFKIAAFVSDKNWRLYNIERSVFNNKRKCLKCDCISIDILITEHNR